ncbi:hydantoin racemase [Colletotrichum truncatum]|uniref:Hydantoin racemase n=1 Tax=Colletotrichum truncatum TaxID=5467 RepID=A0ACC3YZR1_COLTU|nr:hydantoin racemase [Colletotrichum truncatum]KAF6790830.1 hydantoin racemase [Colletotrichum truncatum]
MIDSSATTNLLCIIPISTTGMTDSLSRLYPSTPGVAITFIDGRDLDECPPCIENHEQALSSTEAVLPRVTSYLNSHAVDGVLVCCFSDHPLVYALQEKFQLPITGIFQAALEEATEDGEKFGIVTTAHAWEDILTVSVKELGFQKHSAGVASTGLGVLELESLDRQTVLERIATSSKRLIDNETKSIILGCAGMTALEHDIQQVLPSPIKTIDGVRSGIRTLTRLAQKRSGLESGRHTKAYEGDLRRSEGADFLVS